MKQCLNVLTLFLLACLLIPASAQAQRVNDLANTLAGGPDVTISDRIAAVVNDNVITTSDIKERMTLALLSSGLQPSPEIEQRLLPQILRGLIDEQLQAQEAKRLDISVSKEDIDRALDRIAHDNNIPTDMRTYVQSRGGSATALEQQIRSGVLWSKVVQRELRPRVEIGDDEIEALAERLRSNAGKDEFLVSEIFLSVENPKDDDQVKQAADNLTQQLKSGANFAAVARQFSQSTGAASGGDIGWIQEGQLPSELNQVMLTTQTGQISDPVRTSNGYHILAVRDKRTISVGGEDVKKDITLDLRQAFRPFDAASSHDVLLQEADQLRNTVNDCTKLQPTLSQKFPDWHLQSLGTVKLDQVPAWLINKVRDVQVGRGSDTIATDKGALIVFVCGRNVPEGHIDRDALMNTIGTEKLELQARRLMRDLRRSAYIDVRLGKES